MVKKTVIAAIALLAVLAAAAIGGYLGIKDNGFGLFNHQGTVNTPSEQYAHQQGMPDAVANKFNAINGNVTSDVKAVIDYASHLDNAHQQTVVNSFTADGNISRDEALQSQFLGSLPLTEQLNIIDGGNVSNFDLNGDQMNNYFQHNVAKLPYADNPTGRYALILDTSNNNCGSAGGLLKDFLVNQEKLDPGHVTALLYKNATIANFNQAVSDISHKAGKNDIVYIMLDGHGDKGAFYFDDGKGDGQTMYMMYTNISKALDSISSKEMLVTVLACYSDTALGPLKDGSSPRVFANLNPSWIYPMSNQYNTNDHKYTDNEVPSPKTFDIDKNGYVSIDEIIKTFTKYEQGQPIVVSADKSNIAPNFYFGDFNVDDQG